MTDVPTASMRVPLPGALALPSRRVAVTHDALYAFGLACIARAEELARTQRVSPAVLASMAVQETITEVTP